MPGVERAKDAATCGHKNTGSTSVFANGEGITRVLGDTAGGLIIGPGSQSVYVEEYKVSLPGDAIVGHGHSPHSSARTANPSTNVFAGTGFAGDPGGGIEPKADITTTVFVSTPPNYPANSDGAILMDCCPTCIPPTIPTHYMGTFTFSYTIANVGNADTDSSFKLGIWEVPVTYDGEAIVLTRGSDGILEGDFPILRQEETEGIISSGGSVTWSVNIPNQILAPGPGRAYSIYLDLDNDIGETNENNAFATIVVTVTPCT